MAAEVSRGDILAPHGWPARVESTSPVLTVQSLTLDEIVGHIPVEELRGLELSDHARQKLGQIPGFLDLLSSDAA